MDGFSDTARQAIRWSIPGSVFIVVTASLELLLVPMFTDAALGNLLQEISVGVAIAGILAGIPVGFAIYQLYFVFFHEPSGRITKILPIPVDRGALILRHLTDSQRDIIYAQAGLRPELDYEHSFKDAYPGRWVFGWKVDNGDGGITRAEYGEVRWANWRVVRWIVVNWVAPARPQSFYEYRSLTDVYHGLGASRLAVFMAGVTALVYNLAVHRSLMTGTWEGWAAVAIGSILVAGLFFAFHSAREHTLLTLVDDLVDALKGLPTTAEQPASTGSGHELGTTAHPDSPAQRES